MWFHLSLRSENRKTGPIPVSTSSPDTCPPSCPLRRNGCYAEGGPLSWFWKRVKRGDLGVSWRLFLSQVHQLPDGQLWRFSQAGDLPGTGEDIDRKLLRELVAANAGRRGFAYTHRRPTRRNAAAIRTANRAGFTINLSANTTGEADEFVAVDVAPVVVLLPDEARFYPKRFAKTPGENPIVVCPAERADLAARGITCMSCRLCAVAERRSIVAFPAHGAGRLKAERVALGSN